MRTTMNKNIPLLGLFLLSISAFSPLHAENTFAQELRAECNKIKSEAQLGKQAYDQKKYQIALKHFENPARWSSFCQANADESQMKISDRDVEIAFNNVGLTHQKLGQTQWAKAWFSIRPQSSISQHNLKQLPTVRPKTEISGEYVQYAGFGEWNTVKVKAQKKHYDIAFSGLYMGLRSLIYGPNMGEFETTMTKNKMQTSYQYEQCHLNLNFSTPQQLTITQSGEDNSCGFGHNVSATGRYIKVK